MPSYMQEERPNRSLVYLPYLLETDLYQTESNFQQIEINWKINPSG